MFKGYDLLNKLCYENPDFNNIIQDGFKLGLIRKFDDREWDKIKEQNFISYSDDIKDFYDMFVLGYNIGNCVGASRQLSYSYRNIDIVQGVLPILKGTLNAEKEGGHAWLEDGKYIYDTSLLLVIDKNWKSKIGYIENERESYNQLLHDERYQIRKDFVNDNLFRRKK